MIDPAALSEECLNSYRPGYLDVFVAYHADEFDWTPEYTRLVTRDAVRFLGLSAVPPAGQTPTDQAHVMVSSPDVDKIVDAIFLDSLLLIWLENNVLDGKRMVHVPYYAHGETNPTVRELRYGFTLVLMRAAGYEVDPAIWPDRLPANYKECIGGCPPPCHLMAYQPETANKE